MLTRESTNALLLLCSRVIGFVERREAGDREAVRRAMRRRVLGLFRSVCRHGDHGALELGIDLWISGGHLLMLSA